MNLSEHKDRDIDLGKRRDLQNERKEVEKGRGLEERLDLEVEQLEGDFEGYFGSDFEDNLEIDFEDNLVDDPVDDPEDDPVDDPEDEIALDKDMTHSLSELRGEYTVDFEYTWIWHENENAEMN